MALTNAEKQSRHRERIKAKLKHADDKVCAEEIEAFRKGCDADVAELRSNPDFSDYSLTDLLIAMVKGDEIERAGPFLARAMNLPSDPWPGLTYSDLMRMTKGRTREAQRMGVSTGMSGNHEVGFLMKAVAAKHRAWLEQT